MSHAQAAKLLLGQAWHGSGACRLTFNRLPLIQWCNEGQRPIFLHVCCHFQMVSHCSSAIQQWNIKPLPPSESSLKPYCPPFTLSPQFWIKLHHNQLLLTTLNQSFGNLLYISVWSQGALLLPRSPDTVFHFKTRAKHTDGFMFIKTCYITWREAQHDQGHIESGHCPEHNRSFYRQWTVSSLRIIHALNCSHVNAFQI